MKFFTATCLLAASAMSLADSNRDIYDVMYLPNAGTTYGISDLAYRSLKQKSRTTTPDIKSKGFNFSQSVGHSFTDKFSLQANLNYTKLETTQSGTSDQDTKGISDPSFTGRYRLMDARFRVDVYGGALVSVGDHKIKSNGDDNNLEGGSQIYLGSQIGQKKPNYQWALGALYTRQFKAKTDYSSNLDDDYKDDAYDVWELRADVLNRLLESSFLRTHASVNIANSFKDNQGSETAPATTYEFGTEFQQKILPDLLLRAGVSYLTVNARSGQVERYSGLTFNAGATYQF